VNAGNWIALLGVLVGLLTVGVMVQFRVSDNRRRANDKLELKNERLEAENQALRDSNIDLKIALGQLNGTAAAVDRTLSALPTRRTEGSAT
jgi:hypothetical protein